ncbi:PREDICTED: Werner syndrome ATP-dependent helicase isoform X1 [Thamnophis sirtalis]|uniref:DNA 3'-5' helicase n=1 Tax=Thamnophis sirtalis TaxID=35019 RepID=A0A6I9XGL8_9SAUR|nr:PREDICTED: Werner syndrome ATP-dependent helicase isoform X1 [Thamnophis sirtalis]XP_013910184.1 PREDICTED: Werner syndrome ATP-dependent helicase isoform X1 [Thamnophis sirtalis]XP_013910185.1 PREDICTED: Werner syndrome ATP-dependent helicase isoform X1 [Thamnophis sirtalis]
MGSPTKKLPLWMTEPNNENIADDKKQKNSFQPSVLEDNLPFLEYNGSTIYSYHANDCSLLSEDILNTLPVGAVLGFDIEWPAIYAKGKEGKVALVQLCESETKCYLFHISSMTSFPVGLKRLLEDNTIRKAGVGIEGDKWKLMRDFEIKLENLVDLVDLANEKLKCKETWSLNGLVKHLFHKQLVKDKLVRCGNWECFPLTEEQKLYAATDAYAGFLIYQNLINLRNDKQMHICLKTGGMLLPSEIKNELTSLSKEVLDLAHCVPATFHQSTHIQSATEILADISKNIKALRDILLIKSNCQMELEEAADGGSKLTSKTICKSDHDIDDKTGGVQNSDIRNEEELDKKEHTVDASDTIFKKSTEKEFLMSLDITEYELQMMERQAEEEKRLEAAYMPKDLQSIEDEHGATMESDYELEMEMLKLQSLESTDKSQLNSNLGSLEKQNNHVAEDEGEEGIEEEEESWDSSLSKPSSEQIACLKMYFGHSSFKPVQWKVISSVLQERRDNLVVMATGYGKSLCFQFPPVCTGGIGIVISPLISLMEDQVLQLKMSGVSACLLGSAQSKNVREEIKAGQYRVVYLTPEFCSGNLLWLQQIDKAVGITLIAVDEAHCISEWGHDFRNSFRSLGLLKKKLPKVPIVALTATASSSIRKDIIDCLNLRTPHITCTSFDRPNLYLDVRRKSGNIIQDLLQFLIPKDNKSTYEFEGPTIVYCPSRKTTEQVAAELRKLNLVCGIYHAGLGIKARKDVHHKFMRDEIQCIVATIAFGMGINKADIRTVIHYGAPKEMESYYQEIGRAGRDGLPASCYVLWTPADMSFNRHLISEIHNDNFRLYKLKMMAKIEKYLSLNSCRRRIILSHFEDKQLRKASTGIMGTEKCCDNCRSSSRNIRCAPVIDRQDSFEDFGQQAYKLMSAICALKERFGMGVPILFLRGSLSQRLPDKFRTYALFGSGKDWPEHSWKALGRRLMLEGFLKEVSGQNKFALMCMLTEKGKDWLSKSRKEQSLLLPSDEELYLKKPTPSNKQISAEAGHVSSAGLPLSTLREQNNSLHEMFSYSKSSKMSSQSICSDKSSASVQLSLPCSSLSDTVTDISEREKELQTVLYGKLLAARQKLASERDIPPAVLATNKVLLHMTLIRPTSVEIMKRIDGISAAKSTVLAPLLNIIKEFSQTNKLQTDIFKNSGMRDQPDTVLPVDNQNNPTTESEEHKTYSLFQDKSRSMIQCNKEEQVLNSKQDVQSTHQSAIKLASWNQNSANVEEDLFTDSQSELLSQPSKRKLPEWFGTAKEIIPPVKVSKKSRGGSKGLFS